MAERNGRTDLLKYLLSVALAALVAYFTAIGSIQSALASVKATQDAQFGEILRRMDVLQEDVRELRRR